MLINIRYLNNSVEQFLLFSLGLLGTACYLVNPVNFGILPAASITWMIFRFIFWIGYHIDPLLRGPGLNGTLISVGLLNYTGFKFVEEVTGSSWVGKGVNLAWLMGELFFWCYSRYYTATQSV